ncbi:glycosyltransferase [Nocardia arthritidis]|uniref:Glycosyltransferase n=1 Tax=Nocardia arthritidis TaxID=228602 RepID=A0A6G9YAC0_9NOCA|nr:glycosyltransferase [Nocardia arthritidis]QIS10179.1 glycosyltransferase [Nocardia arthritidis]
MVTDSHSPRHPEFVSVIIPVHNGLPYLDEQLSGLAAQDYRGPYEVLVSDNGSEDGLREHLSGHPLTARLRLRYVDSSAKRGAPFARNNAARLALGDFLAFVDQDDRVHPGWLSALVRTAADYDAVSGALEVDTLNTPEIAASRPLPAPEDGFPTHWLPYANGNNTSYWRTAFERIGGYDEDLIIAGDDVDISWRLQQAGLRFGHAPDALVAYRLRADYRDEWRQSVNYGYGAVQVYVKHRPNGCPRLPLRATLQSVAITVLHNPYIRLTRRRLPRGLWVLHAGVFVGRMRANLRYHTFYG